MNKKPINQTLTEQIIGAFIQNLMKIADKKTKRTAYLVLSFKIIVYHKNWLFFILAKYYFVRNIAVYFLIRQQNVFFLQIQCYCISWIVVFCFYDIFILDIRDRI